MLADEQVQITSCATCGQTVTGNYCSHCGEKVLKPEDKKISHFFEEFFHVLTHADSKFLKSLKYLFTRPGFLTTEYLNGRRKPYTSPLSLFFIANLIYFLFPMVDVFHTPYESQVNNQTYSSWVKGTAEKKMEKRKWTEQQMAEHYNEKSSKISKLFLVLLIFIISIPVSLLFYSNKRYYFDHLIFATEFLNFLILGIFILLPLFLGGILALLYKIFHVDPAYIFNDLSFSVVSLIIVFIQLIISTQRVYSKSGWQPVKAFALTISALVGVVIYRFLIFEITMVLL